MNINKITTFGSANATANKEQQKSDTVSKFEEVLEQLKKGAPPNKPSQDTSDESDTTTVTRILSDGSTLTIVYQGKEIISETRTHALNKEEEPTIIATRTVTDKAVKSIDDADNLASSMSGSINLASLESISGK